jgi:hypothetical protein
METFHEMNNLVGFRGGGKHLVPLLASAGFVDIKVFTASVDNGDWRKGFSTVFHQS